MAKVNAPLAALAKLAARKTTKAPKTSPVTQSSGEQKLAACKEIKCLDSHIADNFAMYRGDSVELIQGIPDNSIHFTVCSPPFSSLFVYSASDRDMGNSKNDGQFFEHYAFLVREQYRITMPGRLAAIHVMQLPTSKVRDGVIGLRDFRGDVIRIFQGAGWIFHSEVTIWKSAALQMMRTKALGLLHKQIRKDSAMCRHGLADYLVVFRKPGENPERIASTHDSFPIPMWQRYASPVWATSEGLDDEGFEEFTDPPKCGNNLDADGDGDGGIDQVNTIMRVGESAREHKDERHLCVLQLGVINRTLKLWSNPGDVVFSPFGGVGSEGFAALRQGRRFLGFELKESYFNQAVKNLTAATKPDGQLQLF